MNLRLRSAVHAANLLRPVDPLVVLHRSETIRQARNLVRTFPGDVAYAVKAADDPRILSWIGAGGIHHWDVASIGEIRAVRSLFPEDHLHYMNPVTSSPP